MNVEELIKKYELKRKIIRELIIKSDDEYELGKYGSVVRFINEFIDDLREINPNTQHQ